ncbi:MAG: tRNA (guanosine(37)-N1)-methyltransferase TrmD [Pseudomonadota bacterium]
MPKFTVISLFPDLINQACRYGVLGRAVENDLVDIAVINPRDYTNDARGTVDDAPYGGGAGMVMKAEPLRDAINSANAAEMCDEVIYLSPQGRLAGQEEIAELAQNSHTIFLCGRYEGIDQRIIEHDVTRELSVGDFVLSGGEFAALCLLDGVSRLLPGVLGNLESAMHESFQANLLEHPHYTRPAELGDQTVPAVLMSGDHGAIARWRRKMSIANTLKKRPELLARGALNKEDQNLIEEIMAENAKIDPKSTE